MANPLLGYMGGAPSAPRTAPSTPAITPQIREAAQSAKRMMNMLRAVKNPQQAMMQAAQQNPQLGAVMQMVGGRNPQQVFYEECQKHGVNPNDVINLLSN